MSGVSAIRYIVATNAALIAAVPATKIFSGIIPQGAIPAIGVSKVGGQQRTTVAMTGKKMCTERVQVTVQAKTYVSKKSIMVLVRAACRNRNGTVNGVELDSILPDTESPDMDDIEANIYTESHDFIVKWFEAH